MPNNLSPSHGVMEGNGSYNKHAKLPADGAATALPLLEKAIKNVELDSGDEPIVIADYGSSQGKNSQIPIKVAVKGLRTRIGPGHAISVFHIDQPANDFNSLFKVLENDPERYVADDPKCLFGRDWKILLRKGAPSQFGASRMVLVRRYVAQRNPDFGSGPFLGDSLQRYRSR